jgi:hypothetical protein
LGLQQQVTDIEQRHVTEGKVIKYLVWVSAGVDKGPSFPLVSLLFRPMTLSTTTTTCLQPASTISIQCCHCFSIAAERLKNLAFNIQGASWADRYI